MLCRISEVTVTWPMNFVAQETTRFQLWLQETTPQNHTKPWRGLASPAGAGVELVNRKACCNPGPDPIKLHHFAYQKPGNPKRFRFPLSQNKSPWITTIMYSNAMILCTKRQDLTLCQVASRHVLEAIHRAVDKSCGQKAAAARRSPIWGTDQMGWIGFQQWYYLELS